MKTIDISKVSSVYSGKDGACACGCSGTHTYASQHREWAGKNRGYAIMDGEVNDATVKRIVNKINRNIGLVNHITRINDCYAVSIGTRVYVAYMAK